MNKKFKAFLALALAALMVFGFAACKKGDKKPEDLGDYQDILDSYLLDIDGTTVNKDFELDAKIQGIDATWESSSEYIRIEKREGENYLAVVTLPDEVTEVTLTVKLGASSKTFTVRVAALDVYVFLDTYAFPKEKQTVVESFDLDTEYSYKGKTATIKWSVDEAYADYLEISEDGKKCLVNGSSLNPTVKIKATFSYNGTEASKTYRFVVSLPMSDLEKADYWYNNTGVSQTISGYVVAKGPWTNYNGTYEAILYVIDDSLLCGYYLYNEPTDMDEETYAALKPGTHVTCVNPVNADYNGLMETSNYKGKTTIDADIDPIDITPYALDNDLIGKVPALRYRQSTLVSLTNWKVKSISNSKKLAEKSPTTLITLTKGGVDIDVQVTKYFYDYSHDNSDPEIQKILNKVASLKVGDWVSVEGVLGWYKNPQINLLSAEGIKSGEKDNSSEFPGAKVASVIAANEKILAENGLDKIIVSEKSFDLLTKSGSVTVEYVLCSKSGAITVDGGNFKVSPAKQEKIHVQCIYTCGDYQTSTFFYIQSALKDDADMAKDEAEAYFLEDQNAGPVSLRSEPLTYDKVKLSFSVVDEESKKLVTISGNTMVLSPVEEPTKVTIRVTATCGEATATKDVSFKILVSEFTSAELVKKPEENTEYRIGVDNGKNVYLATGKMSGYYGTTSTDASESVPAFVEKSGNGYRLYVKNGNTKKYVNITVSGEHYNFTYDDAATTVWSYSGYYFSATVDGKKVWAGSRGSYTTLGCYLNESYDASANNSYPLALYNVVKDTSTPAQRAQKELSFLTVDPVVTENYQLPAESQRYYDVAISWRLKNAVPGQRVANNILYITRGEDDIEVTLIATAKCGSAVKTKEFTVTVAQISRLMSVGQIYDLGISLSSGDITPIPYECIGIVQKIASEYSADYQNVSFWMIDESGESKKIEAYRVKGDAASKVKVGDVVTVSGKVQNYNGTIEFVAGSIIKSRVPATFKTVSELYTEGTAGTYDATAVYSTYGTVTEVASSGDVVTVKITDGKNTVVAYNLSGDSDVVKNIKVDDKISVYGKITKDNNVVRFDGCKIITVTGKVVLTAEESAKLAVKDVKIESLHAGVNELPAESAKYPGVTYVYEVEDAETAKYVTVEGNKLYVLTVAKETTAKIKVTAVCENAKAEATVTTKILVTEFISYEKVETPAVNTEYKLGFDNGKVYLATGEMSGYYGSTSTDADKAVSAYVEKSGNGYNLYVKIGNTKKYVNMQVSGEHYNFTYDDKALTVWSYEGGIFTTMSGEEKIWVGSRGTYTTIGAYKDSQYSATASSSYPLSLFNVVVDESTPAERAEKELAEITLPTSITEDLELPDDYSKYYDVVFEWSLKSEVSGQSVENNVLKITRGEDDIVITLVCKASCGIDSAEKEFTVTVLPLSLTVHEGTASDPYDVNDAIKVVSKLGDKEFTASQVYLKGIVVSLDDKGGFVQNMYIVNAEGDEVSFLVYSANETDTAKDPLPGDTVVVYGYLVNWGGVPEMSSKTVDGTKVYPSLVSVGGGEIVDPEKPVHAGNADDPYTVEDVIKVASKLEVGAYSDSEVYLKGIVKSVTDRGTFVQNMYLVDAEGNTVSFLVYSANETDTCVDPAVGDTVVVRGYLVNYNGTLEMSNKRDGDVNNYPTLISIEKGEVVVPPAPTGDPVHKGTADDPYTVEDVIKVASKLDVGAYSEGQVYVKGIITSCNDRGTYVMNIYLVDAEGDATSFLVYSCNETETCVDPVAGDTVVVYGYLVNYNGTLEMSNKRDGEVNNYPTFVSIEHPSVVDPDETVHAGTADDPYSVEDIIKVASKLEVGAYSDEEVYLKGIVKSVTDRGTFVQNMYLVDAEGNEVSFLVYSANETDTVKDPAAGDIVVVRGYLVNYNGTLEMSNKRDGDVNNYPTLISIEKGEGNDTPDTPDIPDVPEVKPEHAGTEADPYSAADATKIASALEVGKYSEEKVYVKGIVKSFNDRTTFVQSLYLTVKEGDTAAFLVYSANMTDNVTEIAVGDTVTVYGYLVNYNGTPEMSNQRINDENNYPLLVAKSEGNGSSVQGPAHEGTEADPYSAADAVLVASALAPGQYSDDRVYVKGVVKSFNDRTTFVQNLYLIDIGDGETEFLVYSANMTDNVTSIAVGDTVTVYGYFTNYNGTIEMSNKTIDGTKVYPEIVAK